MPVKTYFHGVKIVIILILLVIVFYKFLEPSYATFAKKKTFFATSKDPMISEYLPKITIYRQDTDEEWAKL